MIYGNIRRRQYLWYETDVRSHLDKVSPSNKMSCGKHLKALYMHNWGIYCQSRAHDNYHFMVTSYNLIGGVFWNYLLHYLTEIFFTAVAGVPLVVVEA